MKKVTFDKIPIKVPDGLIEPMIPIRSDICPFCRVQKVELISFNGYPQQYSEAVNAHLMGNNISYNKYEIRLMKCMSCKKEFTIDWSTGFPEPMRDSYKFARFIDEFIMGI